MYNIGEFVLFSMISNRTIPGFILSEFVLSGDPLYKFMYDLILSTAAMVPVTYWPEG